MYENAKNGIGKVVELGVSAAAAIYNGVTKSKQRIAELEAEEKKNQEEESKAKETVEKLSSEPVPTVDNSIESVYDEKTETTKPTISSNNNLSLSISGFDFPISHLLTALSLTSN